jgi:XapX domain-containing protein
VPVQEAEALLVGIVVGIIFARLRLPIPAPPSVAGLLGIVGIYLGYKLSGLF